MYNSTKDLPNAVSGNAARELFKKSGLNNEVLFKIWKLADVDKNGELDKEEFMIAAHLISVEVKKLATVPEVLPSSLARLKAGAAPAATAMDSSFGSGGAFPGSQMGARPPMTNAGPPTIPDFPSMGPSSSSSGPTSAAGRRFSLQGSPDASQNSFDAFAAGMGGPSMSSGTAPSGGPVPFGAMGGANRSSSTGLGGSMGAMGGMGGPPGMGGMAGMGAPGVPGIGPGGMGGQGMGMGGQGMGGGGFAGGPPGLMGGFGGGDAREAEFMKDAAKQSETVKALLQDFANLDQQIFDKRKMVEERKAKLMEMRQFEAKINLQLMQAKQDHEQAQKLLSDGETALVQLNTVMEVSKNNLKTYQDQLQAVQQSKAEVDKQLVANREIAETMETSLLSLQGQLQAQDQEMERQRQSINEAEMTLGRLLTIKQNLEAEGHEKSGEMSRLSTSAERLQQEIEATEKKILSVRASREAESKTSDKDQAVIQKLMETKAKVEAEWHQLSARLESQDKVYQDQVGTKHPDIQSLQMLCRQAQSAVHEFSSRINVSYAAFSGHKPADFPKPVAVPQDNDRGFGAESAFSSGFSAAPAPPPASADPFGSSPADGFGSSPAPAQGFGDNFDDAFASAPSVAKTAPATDPFASASSEPFGGNDFDFGAAPSGAGKPTVKPSSSNESFGSGAGDAFGSGGDAFASAGDAFGASSKDPFSAPGQPSPFGGASEPFGASDETDTFKSSTAPATDDTFKAPAGDAFASKDSPFDSPADTGFGSATVDAFAAPAGDPFAAPVSDAFAAPAGDAFAAPAGDAFASPAGDAFAAPAGDAFAAPAGDAFGAPAGDAFAAPVGDAFAAPAGDAFAAPAGDAFGAPAGDAFAAPAGDAFGAPAGDAFAAPAGDPFGAPAGDAFGAPAGDAFAAPAGDAFAAPAGDPFGAPAGDAFAAPAGEAFGESKASSDKGSKKSMDAFPSSDSLPSGDGDMFAATGKDSPFAAGGGDFFPPNSTNGSTADYGGPSAGFGAPADFSAPGGAFGAAEAPALGDTKKADSPNDAEDWSCFDNKSAAPAAAAPKATAAKDDWGDNWDSSPQAATASTTDWDADFAAAAAGASVTSKDDWGDF